MTKHDERRQKIAAGLKRRYRAERRFQFMGKAAISIALGFLVIMLGVIGIKGVGGFSVTEIRLDIAFVDTTNHGKLVKDALKAKFPDVKSRRDKKKLYKLMSDGAAYQVRDMMRDDPSLIGQTVPVWLTASDDIDMLMKGAISLDVPESDRRISDQEAAWIETFQDEGAVQRVLNTRFFSRGDSREPELAGVWGAVVGSFLTLSVCFLLSFPIGVAAAVYLEEFAPKNKWTDLIEVNINNLAAVPSIVFGLLGLAMFLGFMQLPRSASLVGGMVLALMTLPTIIIASRAALKAVPSSIRQAALGLGASPQQAVFHHALPLAMPGILTGSIIGMAQALGESAPLLMIGMVAFIVDVPGGVTEAATALPVQIYLWADSPERAFVEKTAAAIIVLLTFLLAMNLIAIVLRRTFERRW